MTNRCNKDIYEHGEFVGMFEWTKEHADKVCKDESDNKDSLYLYDWYYRGGRVFVKRLLKTWAVKG